MSEITAFTKTGGPLTKRISLAADGTIISDGSACVISRGTARRIKIVDVKQLAELIEHLNSDQAIALGALRAGLADKVKVVPKDELNGRARPDLIARWRCRTAPMSTASCARYMTVAGSPASAG
jgi:hypothetical protein